jgi:hypothetical protein
MTGQSQVVEPVRPAVLPGDDVLDVKREHRVIGFVELAVFAPVAGPQADGFFRSRADHAPFFRGPSCNWAWALA